MNLQVIVYSPLLEEEQSVTGWSKDTIEYIKGNRSKVIKTIKGVARGISKQSLQAADVEDVYSEILMYLYKSDDYNLSKAIERSSSNSIVSLEGYINICIKYCVIRYMTTEYKKSKEIVRDYTDNNGKELSIFDTLADTSKLSDYESILFDLDQQCKLNEHLRYACGPDIYLIFYIRLLTTTSGLEVAYKEILNVLGITKKDLSNIEKVAYKDTMVKNLAKSIAKIGVEKSLMIIEKYVYSANKIKEVVNCYN